MFCWLKPRNSIRKKRRKTRRKRRRKVEQASLRNEPWHHTASAISERPSYVLVFLRIGQQNGDMKETAARTKITTVQQNIESGILGLGSVTEPQTQVWALRTIFFSVTEQTARPTIETLCAACRPFFVELKRISRECLPH